MKYLLLYSLLLMMISPLSYGMYGYKKVPLYEQPLLDIQDKKDILGIICNCTKGRFCKGVSFLEWTSAENDHLRKEQRLRIVQDIRANNTGCQSCLKSIETLIKS